MNDLDILHVVMQGTGRTVKPVLKSNRKGSVLDKV